MSTLILGITLDDLGVAVILLPLCGALLNLILVTWRGKTSQSWMQPLVKSLGLGIPVMSLVLLVLMYQMLDESTSALVLGPYAIWFQLQGFTFDIALWLDPLSLLWSAFILGLAILVTLYRFLNNDTDEDLALDLAKQQLFLFFSLLVLWADSVPLLYLAWDGMALTAYWLWRTDNVRIEGRTAMFWLTRLANIIFLIGLLWGIAQISNLNDSQFRVRLTFALLEEHRHFFHPGLLYAWLIPAVVYAAQWPLGYWYLKTDRIAPSHLCWFYGFGLSSAGLYLLTRLNVLILSQEFAWYCLELIGSLTALFAAVLALRQKTLRAILAAVVLSHYGLIVCAFGSGNFSIAMVHWFFIALSASLLVLGGGLIRRHVGCDRVSSLGGLLNEMPWVAWSTLVACLALIGLPPLGSFISQYYLLWSFATEARHGVLIVTGLGTLFIAIAVSRWWAAPFLGVKRMNDSNQQMASGRKLSSLFVVVPALLLLALSWAALPHVFFGPEILQTWLLPVFEDHLPIRSERFALALQYKFALVCGIVWFALSLGVFYLYARRRDALSRQSDYWLWWEALERTWGRLISRCRQVVGRGREVVLRNIVHEGLETQLIDGLLITGTGSAFNMTGRALARLQSGRVGHYLIYFLLGVVLLLIFFLQ